MSLSREEWEALPQRVKDYIHELEANADPAGTVREVFALRENVRALQVLLERARRELRDQATDPRE